jgi:spore germination protein YaaH
MLVVLTAAPAARSSTSRSLIGVGFYVDFDPNSWTAVRLEGHHLNWVITTNYVLADPSGALAGSHDPSIVALARSRGSRVHFRVANLLDDRYSGELAHAILTRPAASIRAIASILQVLRDYAYDGVVLDLQNLAPTDRSALTEFVKDLATQLHNRGRPLSVVIPAKGQETGNTTDAYELKALGRAADWIILQAHDTQRLAGPAAPLAPLPWVEAAIRRALASVPASRLMLGIGLFGYDRPPQGSGEIISMREALGRARRAGAAILWDEYAQTPYFTIFGRIVHFEDTRSVERKLSVAVRYHLAGTAFWRLGAETPELWSVAEAFLRPPSTAVSSTH